MFHGKESPQHICCNALLVRDSIIEVVFKKKVGKALRLHEEILLFLIKK